MSGHVKHANAVKPLYFKKAGMLQPKPIAGRAWANVGIGYPLTCDTK